MARGNPCPKVRRTAKARNVLAGIAFWREVRNGFFWVNNNYDRWDYDSDDNTNYMDDVKIDLVPDCQYTTNDLPTIPCARDLEDYFRLWLSGVSSLMKVLPSNYTVQLTLSGDGQIRIFQAIDPDGGTNYLFDETTASNQVANSTSLYVGLLTSSSPIVFSISTNFNEYFIFCGAQTGSAQIDLQVLDANQNVVADAPAFLQINDIKQMYERWTVGESPSVAPKSVADKAVDGVTTAFQYTPPQGTNTPYILFVHGWNMETWEKDRFAETAFKRLYWQGYQGRFGSFRWPTGNRFGGTAWDILSDSRNFDNSEYQAWQSGQGLMNKLEDLNTEYPGHVYLMAHSMGNVVAGEALRLASSQVVNTYIALQGAISAHCYDLTTTTVSLGIFDSGTPDRYAHYYSDASPCYFNDVSGAETYVNFFNVNDYALNKWLIDQKTKPDHGLFSYPGYNYYVSSLHPSGFYMQYGSGTNDFTNFNFPDDVYKIFAYCDEARSYALGAQGEVGGVFNYNQVELDSSPFNFDGRHVFHSYEFRVDYPQTWRVWDAVLTSFGITR